ncbi:membrane-associating domain-containing protein [Phthorimaea operculella]|nr:membrane-associating domain-containing protein [Phthorimaea operculella]
MAPETVVVDHNKPAGQQAPPQQQQGRQLDWIKINIDYFKTPPGMLKVIQLILGILCMALASPWVSGWFTFVAVTSFITTLLWSFVYLLSIREALNIPINWVLSELLSVGLETFFYFIAFIVLFSYTAQYYGGTFSYGANIAAAVFGLFNTIAYGFAAFLLWQEHKSSSGGAGVTA